MTAASSISKAHTTRRNGQRLTVGRRWEGNGHDQRRPSTVLPTSPMPDKAAASS